MSLFLSLSLALQVQLKERTFEPLVEDGEDTWLVQFYLSPPHSTPPPAATATTTTGTTSGSTSGGGGGGGGSRNLKAFASMWNEVSA